MWLAFNAAVSRLDAEQVLQTNALKLGASALEAFP